MFRIFLYLCAKILKLYYMIDEKVLKEKAEKYLICFNNQCSRHESCLRWLVGQHVSERQMVITCINPRLKLSSKGWCPSYRDNQEKKVAKGMVHFYDNMPRKMEAAIKADLIANYTRVGYYDMRKGTRLITSEIEREIRQVCRKHGWTKKLLFDEYTDALIW